MGDEKDLSIFVYKFGCLPPFQESLALQLLGQAYHYEDDLRRIHNDAKRERRDLRLPGDEHSHVVSRIFDLKKERTRDARKRRGHLVDYGTYWLVEEAMTQADKASGLDPIKRREWDGTGRIGAAIQSVEQFPARLWSHKRVSLSQPNERSHAVLSIYVGALKDRLRLDVPIKLHRPFPKDALVKQVAVQRVRHHGHRYKWEAIVTIAIPTTSARVDANVSGIVGIDLGWRSEENVKTRSNKIMRVATDDGLREGSVQKSVLYTDAYETFLYSDAVRGTRDDVFEDVKDYVQREKIPGGETAHLWRSKSRMRRLAARAGDLGLSWWVERDHHLEDIECGTREKAIRRRLDLYRCYADRLAKRYAYVALEDMPMAGWVGQAETSGLERRRSAAALSLLQRIVADRFGPGRVDWIPSAYSSMVCSACGECRAESIGPQPRWTCEACGAEHHQDENAALNLRRNSEAWLEGGNLPRPRTKKPPPRKGKPDGIATGDEQGMTVLPREVEEAAE